MVKWNRSAKLEMVMTYALPEAPRLTKQDIEFEILRSAIGNPSGQEKIRAYHSTLFDSRSEDGIQTCERLNIIAATELSVLQSTRDRRQIELEGTDRFLNYGETEVKLDWTIFDLVVFWICAIFSALALVLAGTMIYTNLVETGISFFIENKWAPLLFSMIPVMAALVVKSLPDWLARTDESKRKYAKIIAITAFLAGVVWLVMFGSLFAGMGQNEGDALDAAINAIANSDVNGTSGMFGSIPELLLFSSQTLMEVLFAALVWMYMQHLYFKHHQVKKPRNPYWNALESDLKAITTEVKRVEERQKQITQRHGELIAAKSVFTDLAVAIFESMDAAFGIKIGATNASNDG